MKPLGVAIVGAGQRAIMFTKFVCDNPDKMRLIGISDPNTAKAELLRDEFKVKAEVYSENEPLISRDDVDAVLVTSPDYAHVDCTVTALDLNKHVYLEKPMATTVEDCDTIIAAAEKSSAICYVGFNLRFGPVYERIHDLIQQGAIGRVTTIEANEWCWNGPFFYFRGYHRLRKYSGGLWLTKAVHDFDIITWMAGARPRSVYATSHLTQYNPIKGAGPRCRDCKIKSTCPDYYDMSKPKGDDCWLWNVWWKSEARAIEDDQFVPDNCLYNSEKDTFDNGIALIEYENDVKATYTLNTLASRPARQMKIIGTEGMIEAEYENFHKDYITCTERYTGKVTHFDLSEESRQGTHSGADDKILADFVKLCVDSDSGTPRSTVTDGKIAVQISSAATESDDIDSPVRL